MVEVYERKSRRDGEPVKAYATSHSISSHLSKATLATSALLPSAIGTPVDEEPAQPGQTNANETTQADNASGEHGTAHACSHAAPKRGASPEVGSPSLKSAKRKKAVDRQLAGRLSTPKLEPLKPLKPLLVDASLAAIRQAQSSSTRDGKQPYSSLDEFVCKHSLHFPKGRVYNAESPWRLTQEAPLGQINALDTFRGRAIATNGVLVAIESEVGFVKFGHMHWFVVDSFSEESAKDLPSAQHPKKPRFTSVDIDSILE